jgi:hypothetical protein
MASIKPDKQYVGIVAASRMLGMNRSTLHKAVKQGKLVPDIRTPRGHVRFHPATIATFAHTLATPAVPSPAPSAPATAFPPAAPSRRLTRLTQMLTTQGDPDQICQAALAILRETVPAVEMGYIALHAPTPQDPWSVHVAAHEGFPSTMISAYRQLGASGMLDATKQVIRTATLVRLDDTADAQAQLPRGSVPVIRELEARTLVVAPLSAEQRACGVITAMSTQPHAFSDGEVSFMRALADHLAAVVVSARALASLRGAVVTGSDLILRALRLRALRAPDALADLAAAFCAATGAYTVCTAGLWEDLPGTEPYLRTLAQQVQDSGFERVEFFITDGSPDTGVVAVIPLPGVHYGAIAAAWHGRRADWELSQQLLTVLGAACLLVSPSSNS